MSPTMASTTLLLAHLALAAAAAAAFVGPRATTLTNPVLWQDHPDLDVFRINSTFYYSSSSFHHSPGAPLLTSPDLARWTPISHSVPSLAPFGTQFTLPPPSTRAYVKGIWASTLRYRPLSDTFYWLGCISGTGRTHVTTLSNTRAGTTPPSTWNWTSASTPPLPQCYYDAGLLVDVDDPKQPMYVAYGNPKISIAQLAVSASGALSEVKSQTVYDPGAGTTLEGARLYRVNGTYYILTTRPADAEFVLRSKSIWGPYERKALVERIKGPGGMVNAGFAHQGGMVDTQDGRWYYAAFLDSYPGGRIPVVAPLEWVDGWPRVVTDAQGRWGGGYPVPVAGVEAIGGKGDGGVGVDEFRGGRLGEEWEWNHEPERSKFKLDSAGGLVLGTVDATGDLFQARNTLTRRIVGPKSSGTFRVDVAGMKDGDRMGAALWRDKAAYIGVWKEGSAAKIVVVTGLTMAEGTWETTGKGNVVATGPTLKAGEEVWLRIEADITPAFGTSTERTATFSYSLDGKTFVKLGPAAGMTNSWRYFTGYRFAVFNHATKALGGEVKVKSFALSLL